MKKPKRYYQDYLYLNEYVKICSSSLKYVSYIAIYNKIQNEDYC